MDYACRHRRSIRLPGFDYSNPGAYFVTINAFRKEAIFGRIINELLMGEWH
jgi:putative transposase